MAMSSNPPQLQLSLGHPTFKRSFHQFGLDIDDAEDSEGPGTASAGSNLANASRSSSASGSGSEAGSSTSGMRSASSGSSYSSQSGDGYGHNGADRSERNKRARSEGPEGHSSSALNGTISVEEASFSPLSSGSGMEEAASIPQDVQGRLHATQGATISVASHQQDVPHHAGFSLPELNFGPPTPSVAEFVALRSSSSNARSAEPPGFSGMLSPRSSSPAPPPAQEIDVPMHDDEDGVLFPPNNARTNRQTTDVNTVLDTGRSEAFDNSTSERLRAAMERARTFDRLLAPLRSDAMEGTTGSSQSVNRPRLPPFDFEPRRRVPSPPSYDNHADRNSSTTSPNPFDDYLQQLSSIHATSSSDSMRHGSILSRRNTAPAPGVSRVSRPSSSNPLLNLLRSGLNDEYVEEEDEDEDDLILNRELVDIRVASRRPEYLSSAIVDGPGLDNVDASQGDLERINDSARLIQNRARAINRLTDRTIDDLTNFISTSESEDDARLSSFVDSLFDASQLDPRLSAEEIRGGNGSRSSPMRAQAAVPASRTSPTRRSIDLASAFYGPGPYVRPISHPNMPWNRSRQRAQGEREHQGSNADRPREWPWPPANELASRSSSQAQANVELQRLQSSRPPESPWRFSMLDFDDDASTRPTSPETEPGLRRIGRMVHLDIETGLRMPGRWSPERERPSASRRPLRTSLPTLRSAILDPLRDEDTSRDLFRQGREGGNAYGSTSAVSSPMPASGLRSRGSANDVTLALRPSMLGIGSRPRGLNPQERGRIEAPPFRSSLVRRENQPSEDVSPRRSGSITVASDQRHQQTREWVNNTYSDTSPPLQDDNRSSWPQPSRNNVDVVRRTDLARRESSHAGPQNIQTEASQREALERRRSMVGGWFPSVHEEVRIRQAEERSRLGSRSSFMDRTLPTSLRDIRERHRLSIGPRPSVLDRTLPASHGERLDVSDWLNSWDRGFPSSVESELFGLENQYPRPEVGRIDSGSNNGATSSTEAAAFFASGPSIGPSGQLGSRQTPAELRQRRMRMLTRAQDNSPPLEARDEPWDDFVMNLDPADTYGFRDSRRSPSPSSRPDGASNTVGDDLLQLLYPGRTSRVVDAGPRGHRDLDSVDGTSTTVHSPDDFEFSDLPSLEESRIRTENFQRTSRPVQDGDSHAAPQRPSPLRSASRPPSLPPLRFDRLNALSNEGQSDNAEGTPLGLNESGSSRVVPWRLHNNATPGLNEQPASRATNDSARNTVRRSSDLAMHHAYMLRSIQAHREGERERERQRGAAISSTPAPGRMQAFNNGMEILGGDSSSNTRRQQFVGAFERENERLRERTRPPRVDTHVRWGEISEDTENRSPGHSPRSWTESFRSRRRSLSALFAPPPDNADNAPPNRARGTGNGTAGGDPGTHSPGSSAPFDWFSMISSSRMMSRRRARFGRNDDEPGPRSFFRLGRSRTGLRNIGDFVRDEDFDTSYESLTALAATLGEVKPRATPAHVLNALPTGLYKDWQSPGSDTRCPICLDDYKDADPVLKAEPCDHWCHKECLEQWLHTASTCPVCRTKVSLTRRAGTPQAVAGPSRSIIRPGSPEEATGVDNDNDSEDGDDDDLSFLSASSGNINRALFEVSLPPFST